MPQGNATVQQAAPYRSPRPHFPSQQHSSEFHTPQIQHSGHRHSHSRRHPVASPFASAPGHSRSPLPLLSTHDSNKTITTLSQSLKPRRRSSEASTPVSAASGTRSPDDRQGAMSPAGRMRERDDALAEQLSASWVVTDGAEEFGMTPAVMQREPHTTVEGPSQPPALTRQDDHLMTRRPLCPPPHHAHRQPPASTASRSQTYPQPVAKSSIRGYDPAEDEARFAYNKSHAQNGMGHQRGTAGEMGKTGQSHRRSLSADQRHEQQVGPSSRAQRRLGPARSAPDNLGQKTVDSAAQGGASSAPPPLPPKPRSGDEAYREQEHPKAQDQNRELPHFAYNASSREEEQFRARQARACEGLSSLCSQWHGSDYNRMKWGAKGAPFAYCPLTIMAPEHVREIMSAQAAYEHELAARSDDSLTASSSSDEGWGRRRSRSSTASRATTVSDNEGPNLKTPVSVQAANLADSWVCKSPTKIHAAAHLAEDEVNSDHRADSLSDLAPSKIVDLHIDDPKPLREEEGFEGTAARPEVYVRRASTHSKRSASNPGSPMRVDRPAISRTNLDTLRSGLRDAMESSLELNDPKVGQQSRSSLVKEPKQREKELKTSETHPLNVSILLPPKTLSRLPDGIEIPEPARYGGSLDKPLLCSATKDIFVEVFAETNSTSGFAPPLPVTPDELKAPPSMHRLGNMLLSSCPGKKVRLDGPVRGRGAICRDLTSDLLRVKEMGVGCIVCCLDDNELKFLGAPWEEYKQSALTAGLDVVRIPMPEGLTPASLVSFDEHVEKAVRKYTLQGIDVLAHCRGGIGRAGLTACAWAVKMGVVGPSPDLERYLWDLAHDPSNTHHLSAADTENARVMSTVERVIYLIRRRRSVKAIETFEQVNFLAAYVAWLRRQSGATDHASAETSSFSEDSSTV